jgi:hypothetical protein
VPPEFDQSRLARMQFQTELRQPFPKFCQETIGICTVFEAYDKIVGISDNHNGSLCDFLAPSFDPQIEDVMQIDIRQ